MKKVKKHFINFLIWSLRSLINCFGPRPVADRILIKQSEAESQVSGLFIPESEREKPFRGIVVAVGPGWRASTTGEVVPMTAKVGDEVIYSIHTATNIEIDKIDYVLVKEGDLFVIL